MKLLPGVRDFVECDERSFASLRLMSSTMSCAFAGDDVDEDREVDRGADSSVDGGVDVAVEVDDICVEMWMNI